MSTDVKEKKFLQNPTYSNLTVFNRESDSWCEGEWGKVEVFGESAFKNSLSLPLCLVNVRDDEKRLYPTKCQKILRFFPLLLPSRMPVQAPSWTEFLICPVCTNEFEVNLRAPITLRCGHSICKKCLATIQQCPYDQVSESSPYRSLTSGIC
jgi:hypothetical protein